MEKNDLMNFDFEAKYRFNNLYFLINAYHDSKPENYSFSDFQKFCMENEKLTKQIEICCNMQENDKENISERFSIMIVKKQIALNNKATGSNWLVNPKVVPSAAIISEAGELIDSTVFEWWKEGKETSRSKLNIIVELVDILHFFVTYNLITFGVEETIKNLNLVFDNYLKPKEYDKYDFIKVIESFQYHFLGLKIMIDQKEETFFDILTLEETQEVQEEKLGYLLEQNYWDSFYFKLLFDAFSMLGYGPEEIFKAYMVKNALNIVRNLNGYKDGTYIKNWEVEEEENITKIEDNHYILENLNIDFDMKNANLIPGDKNNIFDRIQSWISVEYNKMHITKNIRDTRGEK